MSVGAVSNPHLVNQTPYSSDINASSNALDELKAKLREIKNTSSAEYISTKKKFVEEQTKYNDLKKKDSDYRIQQQKSSDKSKGDKKQVELDIALTEGNTEKANQIARDMKALGSVPMQDGKPMVGFELKPKVDQAALDKAAAAKAAAEQAAKDKAAAALAAKNKAAAAAALAAKNKIKGTGTGNGAGTGNPPPAPGKDDGKTIWVDALKATFAHGLDGAQQKEITGILQKAKDNSWTESTFMEALKATSWWHDTAPTLRDYFIQTHDPRNAATFKQTLTNKIDTINASMAKLGITIDGIDAATGKVIDNKGKIKELASLALQNGWDDNQLDQYLAKKSDLIFTGGGAIGSYVDQIKRQGLLYGISYDNNSLAAMQRDLLDLKSGKDAQWYLNNIKQKSIDANPAFAASLKEGRTLYDITSSYRDKMSQLLEVDPSNITWNDLMNKVNKPDGTVSTLADFTKTVKTDPMWQYTKNAKETYSNMAVDLMKQFGFTG